MGAKRRHLSFILGARVPCTCADAHPEDHRSRPRRDLRRWRKGAVITKDGGTWLWHCEGRQSFAPGVTIHLTGEKTGQTPLSPVPSAKREDTLRKRHPKQLRGIGAATSPASSLSRSSRARSRMAPLPARN